MRERLRDTPFRARDAALSRLKHGFESRRERQINQASRNRPITPLISGDTPHDSHAPLVRVKCATTEIVVHANGNRQ